MNVGTNIGCFVWMIFVTTLGYMFVELQDLPLLPITFVLSAAVLCTILPLTRDSTKAQLTQDFLASLKHVESSPDICTICFDICRIPVQLPCGHIECEPCIRLALDHNFRSCSRCGQKFFGSESWSFRSRSLRSILFGRALVFSAILAEMALILHIGSPWPSAEDYKNFRKDPKFGSHPTGLCSLVILIICNNLIARALRISIRHGRLRWHDLATYSTAASECIYYLGSLYLAGAWCQSVQG